MPSFPRYTTFTPEERAALESRAATTPAAAAPIGAPWRATERGSRILKEHTCPVTYPDGWEGSCRYDRQAATIHRFRFRDAEGRVVATLWHSERLPSSVTGIEEKVKELLPAAFTEIVERERKEYFARASETPERKAHPERFQMAAGRAKEVGGRYALCVPLGERGERLLPVSEPFATLDEANAAWRAKGDPRLVVACGNRLDRCWERPTRNALYAEFPAMAPAAREKQ